MSPDYIRFTVHHAQTPTCIGLFVRLPDMVCSHGAPSPTGGATLFQSRRCQRLLDSRLLSNPPTTAPPICSAICSPIRSAATALPAGSSS
jgi:hypothetical protein